MNYELWIVQFKEIIILSEIINVSVIKIDYSNRNKNATRAYSAGSIDQSKT